MINNYDKFLEQNVCLFLNELTGYSFIYSVEAIS